MKTPTCDPNCFSPRRFCRFIADRKSIEFVLSERTYVGGELIFESPDSMAAGRFALRSEGGIVYFTSKEAPVWEPFVFGDKIEVTIEPGSTISSDPHITVTGGFHLKLLVRPTREIKPSKFNFQRADQWRTFIQRVRHYFDEMGFIETLTPTLVKNPGMEPELEPFGTVFQNARGVKHNLFLPTSPELHLKQILCAGFTEIYEIKSCYRNEEMTSHHEPEFQMLEWYRAYANLAMIETDMIGLLRTVTQSKNLYVERISISDLFWRHFEFKLTPSTSRGELASLAKAQDIRYSEDDSWNDLFHRIFVSRIERSLGVSSPVVIYNFPPSQAALARLTDEGWADRFELFWNGLEIANAFHELNDPVEQRHRFENDQSLRLKKGRTPLGIDENFMQALEAGLPPSAGIALGLDRLFMAIHGISEIRAARFFGVEHQL